MISAMSSPFPRMIGGATSMRLDPDQFARERNDVLDPRIFQKNRFAGRRGMFINSDDFSIRAENFDLTKGLRSSCRT